MASRWEQCRCGATLPDADVVGLITCPSCGRVSHADEAPDNRVRWVGRSLETATVVRRAKGVALVALIGLFFVASTIAFLGFRRVQREAAGRSGAHRSRIVVAGSVLPLDERDSSDVVAVVQDYTDTSHRYVARLRIDADRITERWTSPELPGGTDRVDAVLTGRSLVVAFSDRVWSLDAEGGGARWRAKVSDQIPSGCATCLAVVGDRVLVRTADAYLTGFRLATPSSPWRRRLVSTGAQLAVVGQQPVVVDESPDLPGAIVQPFDAATGAEALPFRPECPAPDRLTIGLNLGDEVRTVPGSGDAISISAFGDGCVVRWDLATRTVRWASRIDGLTDVDRTATVMSASDLALATAGGRLVHVDLATGAARFLDAGPGVQARPSRLVGRRLLAWTIAAAGAGGGGLQAFDLASGAQQWAAQLPNDSLPLTAGAPAALSPDHPRGLLSVAGARVEIIVLAAQGQRLDIGQVDLATGFITFGDPLSYRTRYGAQASSVGLVAERDGNVLITVDDQLERIDASTGMVTTYP